MPQFEIHPFDTQQATQAEYEALNRHSNLMRLERLPDDPPIPVAEMIQQLQNIPPFLELKIWCIWETLGSTVIAQSTVELLHMEENKHLAAVDITVEPEYRRQGWGRQLLARATEAASADSRRLLLASTYDRIPDGEAFMLRLGAHRGLEGHVNQLRIVDIDRDLVERWLEQGQAHLAEFELGLWDGPYPEDQLPAVAQLVELTNQQPFGDLEIGEMHMTPEQLRQSEKMLFSRGSQRWTYFIVERATGKFAGYTETVWNPNRPEILNQDMTGVFPEFRNRGLGRWLKAAMLARVLADRPQVKFVRTGNADSNAAMLKINIELGFMPYMASTLWQAEIERVQAYLGSH